MKQKKDKIVEEVVSDEAIVEEKTDEVIVKNKGEWAKKIFYGLAYSIIPFIFFLIVQQLSWTGNMLLGKPGAHPEIWLDSKIPVVSEFVWVYYLTFPVAIFTYFLVAYKDKKHLWNLWLALMISFAISGIVYFFWQTEMVKPELEPKTLSDKFLLLTWGTCKPICCLPSQHCFMALGMILGLYNQKKTTSPWLRWPIMICGVLVILSTVFLKQHYVLDFVASFFIMVPTYLIAKYAKFGDHMVKKFGHWVWFGKNNKPAKTTVTSSSETVVNIESANGETGVVVENDETQNNETIVEANEDADSHIVEDESFETNNSDENTENNQ